MGALVSKMNDTGYKSNPLNFLQATTLLFVGLKLTDHITWPWYWVIAPMYLLLVVIAIKEWSKK